MCILTWTLDLQYTCKCTWPRATVTSAGHLCRVPVLTRRISIWTPPPHLLVWLDSVKEYLPQQFFSFSSRPVYSGSSFWCLFYTWYFRLPLFWPNSVTTPPLCVCGLYQFVVQHGQPLHSSQDEIFGHLSPQAPEPHQEHTRTPQSGTEADGKNLN